MSLVSSGVNVWPQFTPSYSSQSFSGGFTTLVMDTTTDVIAYVGTYHGDADSIASVKFMVGAIAATAGTGVVLSVETVADGRPTGTLWNLNGTGASPKASVTIADIDDNTYKTATLTNAANLVAGDEFAITIRYEAGNDDGTFNVPFNMMHAAPVYPSVLHSNAAAAYTQQTASLAWVVSLTTAGPTYFPGLMPVSVATSVVNVNNSAAADERALKFQVPAPMRAIGARVMLSNVAAAGNFQFCLWSSTGDQVGEELAQTASLDTDLFTAATVDGWVEAYFSAAYTLAANTTYYLGVKSLSATNTGVMQFSVPVAADKEALPFGSSFSLCQLAYRTWDETPTPDLAGAWTEGATEEVMIPMISIVYDQIDNGAGGAGGIPMSRIFTGM